jgi:tetratricopeptide (TPR) repeat protein
MGSFEEAGANLDVAARLFERAKRPYDRALALVAKARLEIERGDPKAATRAARRAASFAKLKRFARVQQLAAIQEARAHLLRRDTSSAIKVLNKILAGTVSSADNVVRFYSHYNLSKAYAAAGDPARSQAEFEQAKYFVRFVDQASKEASEVRGHLKYGSIASKP